jgi:hypothetical protein
MIVACRITFVMKTQPGFAGLFFAPLVDVAAIDCRMTRQ